MKINKRLRIVFFLCMGYYAGLSQTCELANILQVDAKVDEWTMEWIADDDFSYNVCHDANNIYVRFKSAKEYVKRKIGLYGFTLWIDPNGKKKRKYGLKFPTGIESSERIEKIKAEREQDNRQLSAGERVDFQRKIDKDMVADLELIELIGLADEPLTSTRSGITNGMKVAIALEGEEYVYEALIPFKAFRISKTSTEELGIGLETGKYIVPKVSQAGSTGKQAPPPQANVPSEMHRTTSLWFSLKTN